MHNERQIWGIQRRQLGLVTARQCAEHGLSRKIVARLVAAGRWARVLPGVFRECVHPESHEQMTLAATLWAAPSGIASHAASGFLMRLDGVRFDRPHLWVPSTRSARSDLVVVHRGEIEAVDRRMIGPVPVTSPARTRVDLAGVLGDEDLEAAVEDAVHRGLTTPQSIARRLEALGGQGSPGTARLREVVLPVTLAGDHRFP